MSESQDDRDPEQERIRRILKQSRKIKASGDFEERLFRRLRSAPAPRRAGTAGRPVPWRVPAYAYSLLAVAVVGVLSYYMFIRPSEPPAGGEPASGSTPHEFRQERAPRGKGASPDEPGRDADRHPKAVSPAVKAPTGGGPADAGVRPGFGEERRMTKQAPAVSTPTEGNNIGEEQQLRKEAEPVTVTPQQESGLTAPAVSAPTPVREAAPKMKAVESRGLISTPRAAAASARRLDSLKSDSLRAPLDTVRPKPARKPTRP